MVAILDLGDGLKFACENLDAAIEAWRDNFSELVGATIDVYPKLGVTGLVQTFYFDEDDEAWVKSN